MKKWILTGLCLALVAFAVAVTVATVSPVRLFRGDRVLRWFDPPCDIGIAIAEVEMVKRGIDPYVVWHGDVVVEGYKSGLPSNIPAGAGCKAEDKIVNVHPPWFYTAMFPLGLVPERVACAAQFFLMLGCLAFLVFFTWSRGVGGGVGRLESLMGGIVPVLAIAMPVFQDFCSQNWAIFMLTAAVLMAICLNRADNANGGLRWNLLAGACWAVIMIKPQVGLVFAVPLLARRKWTTCITAVLICIVASFPPALLCGVSPLKMIMDTPGSNSYQFWGCGTFPSFLCGLVSKDVAILIGLVVGVVACIAMMRLLSGVKDWLLLLMPAAVCSMCWTYARCYSHVMAWFFFACMALAIFRAPRSRFLWVLALVALPAMSRIYNCLHCAARCLHVPPLSGCSLLSDANFPLLDTLNSSVDLVLAMAFCAWLSRRMHRGFAS